MSDVGRRKRAAIAAGQLRDGGSPSPEGYKALRGELHTYLHGVTAELGIADADDLVDEAVTRFVANIERVQGLTNEETLGYLMRILRNAFLDRVRRNREVTDQETIDRTKEAPVEDDAIFRLIEDTATHTEVQLALRQLREQGQTSTASIVLRWMNIASGTQAAPSAREVGRQLGIQHQTVAAALSRLKEVIVGNRLDE